MKRFMFNFHHEENEGEDGLVYFFEITPKADDPTLEESSEFEWLDFLGNMERYGVHDFTATGDELVGYHSYEIKLADQPSVVEQWRKFMADGGYQPGEIEVLEYEAYHARFGMKVPDWDAEANRVIYREPRVG